MVKADKKVPKAAEKTVEKKPKAVKAKKAAEKPAQEVTKTIKKTKIKKRPFARYVKINLHVTKCEWVHALIATVLR